MKLALVVLVLTASLSLQATAAEKFLADRHADHGISCEACHGKNAPKDIQPKACLNCHGPDYAALAKKTDDKDINPHATHMGEVNCFDCHQGHKPPRLVCNQCHEFSEMLKVP